MGNLFVQIGNNIQELIKIKKISQSDLAEKIGVSKQVMSKIIHGKKAINVQEIAKIAEAIGTSVDELIKENHLVVSKEPVLLMMGSISNENTKDDLKFLNHVMDEMIALDELLKN